MTTIVNEPDRLEQVGVVHRITLSTDSEQPGVLLTVSPFGQSIVGREDLLDLHAWLGEALGATVDIEARTEWAELPDGHDEQYEYTTAADCDGTFIAKYRRTPRRVIDAGAWERVAAGEEKN